MKKYKGKDSSMKSMSNQSNRVMKNHGNTQMIKADCEKYDMGRMKMLPHENKGNNPKAFDYSY